MRWARALLGAALLSVAFSACGEPGPVGVYELDLAALEVGGADPADTDALARNERTAADLRSRPEVVAGSLELRADQTASGRLQWLTLPLEEWTGTWQRQGDRLTIQKQVGEEVVWTYRPGSLSRTATLSLLEVKLTFRRQ